MTRAPTEACLVNIGPRGVLLRRRIAATAALATFGGLVAIELLDLPLRWRALLILPAWVAALCWFQAAAKT